MSPHRIRIIVVTKIVSQETNLATEKKRTPCNVGWLAIPAKALVAEEQ